MKLVDILARELKVWPEGNYFAWQDYDREIRFSHTTRHDFHASILADDHVRSRHGDDPDYGVTRAEWQAAVDALNAPKVVEWDGVGDPPVGVVCQYSVLNGPWYTCEVGYSFFDGEHRCFVIKCKHLGFEQVCRIDPGSEGSVEFRPFRTAEQVAAEEREAEDNEVMSRYMSLSDCEKGILGHSPERVIIGLMRLMGYRKEPKPCGS